MLQENQVLLWARERETSFLFKPDALGTAVTRRQLWRVSRERDVQRQQVAQSFQNPEHSEAQLRVKLQTEELIMKFMNEGFQETSEIERQGVISARELAAALRSEMSQEVTVCSLEKRSNKIYKRCGGAKHEENCRRKLLALLIGSSIRTGLIATQTSRPAIGNQWEHTPSISMVLSETRSIADASSSNSKEAEKFELEPWPQASRFDSWKSSFVEKRYQDQLILDSSAIECQSLMSQHVWKNWIFQGSCSTTTKWSLKLWIRRSPTASWTFFLLTSRERSISYRILNTRTDVQCSTSK